MRVLFIYYVNLANKEQKLEKLSVLHGIKLYYNSLVQTQKKNK